MKHSLIFFMLVGFLLVGFVCAQDNVSDDISIEKNELSMKEQAASCLQKSEKVVVGLENESFATERVGDILEKAKNIYDSQLVLESKKGISDFSIVIPYCDEIFKIEELAYISRDNFLVLKGYYENTFEGQNETIAGKKISEIEFELQHERYEKIQDMIDDAYETIAEIKSGQTALGIFYESTTKSLKRFIERNKYFLLGFIGLMFVLYLVYRNAIRRYLIKKKIISLNARKKVLKRIITATQRDYFNKGLISEGTFNIRTKKLGELIRDIDRQIPLLREELEKIRKKNKNKKERLKWHG